MTAMVAGTCSCLNASLGRWNTWPGTLCLRRSDLLAAASLGPKLCDNMLLVGSFYVPSQIC
jgi:hypothetical protein